MRLYKLEQLELTSEVCVWRKRTGRESNECRCSFILLLLSKITLLRETVLFDSRRRRRWYMCAGVSGVSCGVLCGNRSRMAGGWGLALTLLLLLSRLLRVQ